MPINKHGKQSSGAVRAIEEIYATDDTQVLYFPAGLISRRKHGNIEDLAWKKTFVNKAVQHKRDVVPVHISGRVSGFFYRLARFREFIGIKNNFEMIYLPNEMFKQKGMKLRITFGKPIPYNTFDKTKKPNEWAYFVKKQVYSLAGIEIKG